MLGFVAGIFKSRFPLAARIFTLAVVAGYVAILALAGAWVAACPRCESHQSYDSTRALDLIMAFMWGGLFLLSILAFIRIGDAIATFVQRARTR